MIRKEALAIALLALTGLSAVRRADRAPHERQLVGVSLPKHARRSIAPANGLHVCEGTLATTDSVLHSAQRENLHLGWPGRHWRAAFNRHRRATRNDSE